MSWKYHPETSSEYNISTQNDCWDKLKTQFQQAKVHILTLFSSKGQYMGFIYFNFFPKNKNIRKILQQQQQQAQQQQQLW